MIKNKIKLGLYSGLAAMTMSCSTSDNNTTRYVEKEQPKQVDIYSFDKFGEIYENHDGIRATHKVFTADLDGDGDFDIIIGSYSKVSILENKIEQKNSK